MIEDVDDTAEAIKAALREVEVTVYDDPAATVDRFPAAIIGAPILSLQGISSMPAKATFPVALMTKNDKNTVKRLIKLVPQVVEAIRDGVEDAEITEEITPAVIQVGAAELPGYMILVEV